MSWSMSDGFGSHDAHANTPLRNRIAWEPRTLRTCRLGENSLELHKYRQVQPVLDFAQVWGPQPY